LPRQISIIPSGALQNKTGEAGTGWLQVAMDAGRFNHL
jgi:hypothetical protein